MDAGAWAWHLRGAWLLRLLVAVLVLCACVALPVPAHALDSWQHRQPPLSTPWTQLVDLTHALPEYPRPQMVRTHWRNLNGGWDYTGWSAPNPPGPNDYHERILVPYPTESALSGIQRHDDQMWYHKTLKIPRTWWGQRVLLHFGAVDQVATVWVNNHQVGYHEGGYTSFTVDITDALQWPGPQNLSVRVEDHNENSPYAVGKQRNQPHGLTYTGASGIWQTVWMEPVRATHVSKLDITPDLTSFAVTPAFTGPDPGHVVVAVATRDGREVARASGKPGDTIRVPVPAPHLWTPDDPYLYDIKVWLINRSGKMVDEISSYGGLRTIGIVRDSQGRPRIALNNQIVFLQGVLDQGYWPDGIYTAPTDDALKSDLEQVKKLGLNTVRKHAKVEPARWYYWADKLGLMVLQDMPSLGVPIGGPWGPDPDPPPDAKGQFEKELSQIVDQLHNVTSIVGWVPFNEGWGEYDTARIANQVKAQDPTRLVDAESGVNCCKSRPDSGAGDIYDDHTYVGPGATAVHDARAAMIGEYGGIGLVLPDNRWPGPPEAYEMTSDQAQLTKRYLDIGRDLERQVRVGGLSGAIYTQTTDVENEVNGYLSYDRRLVKVDVAAVAAQNRAVIAAGGAGPPPGRS
ncbi:glycoside hydrolase family 2 protein [Mycolicibacterium brisbanense]